MFEEPEDMSNVATAEAAGFIRQAEDEDVGRQARYRVTLPRQTNFFEEYPRKWTWESWGKRVEQEWLMIARGIEAVIWGTVGALAGLAISAVPGAFIHDYHFVIWQPVGAALGAISGAGLVWRRWKNVFSSHQSLSR